MLSSPFPFQFAACSQPGRKHQATKTLPLINEDSFNCFSFSTRLGSATCFYVADGHGQVSVPSVPWVGSRAELFFLFNLVS